MKLDYLQPTSFEVPEPVSKVETVEFETKDTTAELPENKEQENDVVEDNSQGSQEEIGSEQDTNNPFILSARDLVDKGLVDLEEWDENEYDFEEWNQDTYGKFLETALRKSKEREASLVEKTSDETFEYLMTNMSDITRKGFQFERSNPDIQDVKEFYKQLVFEADITSLNPKESGDAEKILLEYYKSTGESYEDARDRINNLKDPLAEALKVKPKLDAKVEQIALSKLEEQNKIMEYEKGQKLSLSKKVDDLFKEKSLDGIPLTESIKDFLKGVIVNDEFSVKIKGKDVSVGGAEFLMMYHKYHEKGNLKHLAKALVFLQEPELFEKYIRNEVRSNETNRFIKDHKSSAGTKSGILVDKSKKSESARIGPRL